MSYIVTATVRSESVRVDLADIGFNDESRAAPGRVVTHPLSTGDFQVRSQGYAPVALNCNGEYDPGDAEAEAAMASLIRMRGHAVTLRRGNRDITGHLRNVNPTYHDWMESRFQRVTWRADIVLDQEGTLVEESEEPEETEEPAAEIL